MIDWWALAANSLWILGLSVLLASTSYHGWVVVATGRTRRHVSRDRSWRWLWATSMFLVCAGWGLSQASRWWERSLWFALAASFAWDLVRLVRARAISNPGPPPPSNRGET